MRFVRGCCCAGTTEALAKKLEAARPVPSGGGTGLAPAAAPVRGRTRKPERVQPLGHSCFSGLIYGADIRNEAPNPLIRSEKEKLVPVDWPANASAELMLMESSLFAGLGVEPIACVERCCGQNHRRCRESCWFLTLDQCSLKRRVSIRNPVEGFLRC